MESTITRELTGVPRSSVVVPDALGRVTFYKYKEKVMGPRKEFSVLNMPGSIHGAKGGGVISEPAGRAPALTIKAFLNDPYA